MLGIDEPKKQALHRCSALHGVRVSRRGRPRKIPGGSVNLGACGGF